MDWAEWVRAMITVSHVPDFYHRYIGEPIQFFTRLESATRLTNCQVTICAPGFVNLRVVEPTTPFRAQLLMDGGKLLLRFDLHELPPAMPFELTVAADAPNEWQLLRYEEQKQTLRWENGAAWRDVAMMSDVAVSGVDEQMQRKENRAAVSIRLSLKGAYLQYLPALYEQDDLLGRYLMLFERSWSPIEERLAHSHCYFDAKYAPVQLLSWLAWCLNSVLDESWPEAKRRRLLTEFAALYRKRGTKAGLKALLEIYTESEVEIIEHWAGNLQLGVEARLGRRVALGKDNSPATFTVKVRWPATFAAPDGQSAAELESVQYAAQWLQKIHTIVAAEKPAHTQYRLIASNAL